MMDPQQVTPFDCEDPPEAVLLPVLETTIQWFSVEDAYPPAGRRVLCAGGAQMRIGFVDDRGNWRNGVGGYMSAKPKWWAYQPEVPE